MALANQMSRRHCRAMQDDQSQTASARRLVALLSAREVAPEWPGAIARPEPIRIGLQLIVEHQARQLALAGATDLIVYADSPSTELLRALDRLSRDSGLSVAVASDGPALVRKLDGQDRVLLVAERIILPQQAIDDLAHAVAPAFLVTPSRPESAHFERIDANHVWAGGALLPAAMVLSTVDMLGEWDLVLTLLRRAVQGGAVRIELPAEAVTAGSVARLAEQADADRLLDALATERRDGGGGDLLSVALGPLRRRLVAELARRQAKAGHLALSSALLSFVAVALVSLQWPILALLVALFAEACLDLGLASAQLMLERRPPDWLRVLVKGSSLAVLAVIGGRLAGGVPLALAGVLLPLAWVALKAVAYARGGSGVPAARPWTRLTTAMALLLVLGGAVLGAVEEAFLLLGLSAFGTAAVPLLAVEGKRI